MCKGSCRRRRLRDCFCHVNFAIPPPRVARHGRMSSKCNTQNFSRRKPTKAFSRFFIDFVNNFLEAFIAKFVKIVAFWEIITQNIVGIFVCAVLPRLMRLSKVYIRMQLFLKQPEFGKFRTVIQRETVHRKSSQTFHNSFACFVCPSASDNRSTKKTGVAVNKRNQQSFSDRAVNSVTLPITDA